MEGRRGVVVVMEIDVLKQLSFFSKSNFPQLGALKLISCHVGFGLKQ